MIMKMISRNTKAKERRLTKGKFEEIAARIWRRGHGHQVVVVVSHISAQSGREHGKHRLESKIGFQGKSPIEVFVLAEIDLTDEIARRQCATAAMLMRALRRRLSLGRHGR
jgi:hypothetical protein